MQRVGRVKHLDKKYERCSKVFIVDFEQVFTHKEWALKIVVCFHTTRKM